MHNFVAVCLLSESDLDSKPINPALDNDDQAPGDDFQARAGPGPAALPPPAPAPWRQADIGKTMQDAGGPNIERVMQDINADSGQNLDPIQSKRFGRIVAESLDKIHLSKRQVTLRGLQQRYMRTSHQRQVPSKKQLKYWNA